MIIIIKNLNLASNSSTTVGILSILPSTKLGGNLPAEKFQKVRELAQLEVSLSQRNRSEFIGRTGLSKSVLKVELLLKRCELDSWRISSAHRDGTETSGSIATPITRKQLSQIAL